MVNIVNASRRWKNSISQNCQVDPYKFDEKKTKTDWANKNTKPVLSKFMKHRVEKYPHTQCLFGHFKKVNRMIQTAIGLSESQRYCARNL